MSVTRSICLEYRMGSHTFFSRDQAIDLYIGASSFRFVRGFRRVSCLSLIAQDIIERESFSWVRIEKSLP